MADKDVLRAARLHACKAWCANAWGKRFEEDDGRILAMADQPFWPQAYKDAEQAFFDDVADVVYDELKDQEIDDPQAAYVAAVQERMRAPE